MGGRMGEAPVAMSRSPYGLVERLPVAKVVHGYGFGPGSLWR